MFEDGFAGVEGLGASPGASRRVALSAPIFPALTGARRRSSPMAAAPFRCREGSPLRSLTRRTALPWWPDFPPMLCCPEPPARGCHLPYNASLTLEVMPLEAYRYIVNGRTAIEWMMERYRVRVDMDSGIKWHQERPRRLPRLGGRPESPSRRRVGLGLNFLDEFEKALGHVRAGPLAWAGLSFSREGS